MFDSHHGVIARMLLDQVAFLDQQITGMQTQAIAALAQVPQSWGVDPDGETGPAAGTNPGSPVLAAAHRLAEIPGLSLWLAIVIIAEIGLNMSVFPTPAHLISWMGLCRSAAQSGTRHGKGKPKKGNSYARAAAGQAAIGAARTSTFLGERYSRIPRRRGKPIAQTAAARDHHDHRLAPARRSDRPLPRPRPGLARPPHQPGQEDPQPPPWPESARRHRRHHRRRAGRLAARSHRPGQARNHQQSQAQTRTPPHRSAAASRLGRIYLVRTGAGHAPRAVQDK
jgi:transposase